MKFCPMCMKLSQTKVKFEVHITCETIKTDNMKELKCPHCGSVFTVDEADYASIVSQVKNAEFDAEIERRIEELEARHKAEQELAKTKSQQEFTARMNAKEQVLNAKDLEIERLKSQMESLTTQLNSEKEMEIGHLKDQLAYCRPKECRTQSGSG